MHTQLYFYTLAMNYPERKFFKKPFIYNSIKINKIFRNKFNQVDARLVEWKLQNITERKFKRHI